MVEGGIKNDNGKPRISLIPKDAIWAIANGLTYGAKKYGTHNFRNGIKYSRLLDAIFRHLTAWEEGEDIDTESGNNHLDHAGASLAMLIFMAYNRPDLDDRYKGGEIKKQFKFDVGDRVKHTLNDGPAVTVAGNYFDVNLKHCLFVRDDNGKTFAVDENAYNLSITSEGNI